MIKSSIFGLNQEPMKLSAFFLLCLSMLTFQQVFAQYTETLNSNRPGISQGAFSVGKNVLQLETGFGLGQEEHFLLNTETDAYTIDYAIRYGFWKEQLEVSVIGEFQSNMVTDNRTAVPFETTFSNFSSNTVGAKYLLYDPYRKRDIAGPNIYSWKANNGFHFRDLIPAIALYAGANFDLEDNPFSPEQEMTISPKVVLSTQNNWSGGWVFVTNIYADRIATEFPSYGYVLTLTHSFNSKFSAFVENQGIKSDFYADQLFRGGAAYLFTRNFQVDASLLTNFKDTPSRLYGRIGLSYRLDMHNSDEALDRSKKE